MPRPVDVVTQRSSSVRPADATYLRFDVSPYHISCLNAPYPPCCVFDSRFETCYLHFLDGVSFIPFLGCIPLAGHFVLTLLFTTSGLPWHSMGAAVILFAFAGRIRIDLRFWVWEPEVWVSFFWSFRFRCIEKRETCRWLRCLGGLCASWTCASCSKFLLFVWNIWEFCFCLTFELRVVLDSCIVPAFGLKMGGFYASSV